MGAKGSPEYRAQQRERERQRRHQAQRTRPEEASSDRPGVEVDGRARRAAATTCGWCGGLITLRSRGPIPKWYSATCRHRAWEQARATTSDQAAVRVVERQVEIRVPLPPTRRDWPRLLSELAGQLDDGPRLRPRPTRPRPSPRARAAGLSAAGHMTGPPTCGEPQSPELLRYRHDRRLTGATIDTMPAMTEDEGRTS